MDQRMDKRTGCRDAMRCDAMRRDEEEGDEISKSFKPFHFYTILIVASYSHTGKIELVILTENEYIKSSRLLGTIISS